MLMKRAVIAAKVESTYNTDAVPTAASDAIRVENLTPAPAEAARMSEQPVLRPSLATKPHLYAGSLMALEFDCAVKGSGTADGPPEYAPLLKACGCAETVTVGTSVAYQPASDSHDSVSIYFWQDGLVYKLTGARGNAQFLLNMPDGYGRIRFRMVGHVSGPIDEALPAPTLDATSPPTIKGAGITLGGITLEIASLSLDMANSIATPDDLNGPDGYGEITITARDCNGGIDPKAVTVAVKDLIGNWRSGAEEALTTAVIGPAAGNRFQLAMPVTRIREPSQGDRDGIVTHELTFGAHEDTGDDEFSLTFT